MGHIMFDDLTVGDIITTAARTITETDITVFAGLSGDFNPLHTDAEFARLHTPFGARIAHGLLITSVVSGLRSSYDDWAVLAYLDFNRRFVHPVYPQDTVRAEYRVTELRRSRTKNTTGIATLEVTVCNQKNETVQIGTEKVLVETRQGEPK